MGKRTVPVVVILAMLAAAAAAAEAPAVPRIYLPEAKFEFGRVKAGGKVEHLFEVRNAGHGVLRIERVQPS